MQGIELAERKSYKSEKCRLAKFHLLKLNVYYPCLLK
jgi:hypothetical protein